MKEQTNPTPRRLQDLHDARTVTLETKYPVGSTRPRQRDQLIADDLHAEWKTGMRGLGIARLLMADLAHSMRWQRVPVPASLPGEGCAGDAYWIPAPEWIRCPKCWAAHVIADCHGFEWMLEPEEEWVPEIEFLFPCLSFEGGLPGLDLLWPGSGEEKLSETIQLTAHLADNPDALSEALAAALERAFDAYLHSPGFSESWLSARPEAQASR